MTVCRKGKNGEQFTYPGVAWVLGKYWEKFTPAQRDHLKARLKEFSDLLGHGTENHAIMKCAAAYYTAFRLLYQSPDRFNFIECYHPYWRSDDRTWQGLNSPFMQWAQHKGTAIALFNIPTADPWKGRSRADWRPFRDGHYDNPIQEALVRYPKSIDQKTEASGWIFLREGDVYIAIRPLKEYAIDANYKPAGEFNVVRSAFAQTGFVFDLATKEEFATFEAFQTAVNQNPPTVDWEQLSVAYKSVKGDTLTASWNPPEYDVPKGERVLVRTDITVNGAAVPIDSDFISGRAVMKSPSVELIDRVLRLRTPEGPA